MSPFAAVLVCALDLLGRSHAIAPIALVASAPPEASRNVEGFVTRNPDTIHIVTSTAVFRDALGDPFTALRKAACRKLASIIVHEEWHLLHGSDEQGAYEAQLMALQALGADSATMTTVRQSMAAVLAARRQLRRADFRPTASPVSLDMERTNQPWQSGRPLAR